ncbi:MAG: hypothetical protein ACI8V2_001838 [Candidatus Latescibacterota bacterium]|jgi:hypothetical protein
MEISDILDGIMICMSGEVVKCFGCVVAKMLFDRYIRVMKKTIGIPITSQVAGQQVNNKVKIIAFSVLA